MHRRQHDNAPDQGTGPGRIGWRAGMLYALLPVLGAVIFTLPRIGALRDGRLINPDSYTRLVRLQAILQAGRPLDDVSRDASGAGMVLHWSHLLDSLLVLLMAPLEPWLGQAQALHVAALLAAPLEMAALGLAIAWAAAPFADRGRLWFAPLLAGLAPAITGYGLVGVVHHHVLAVVVAVMLAGWAARVIAAAETPVVAPPETPVVAAAETPVVAPAEPPVVAPAETRVTAGATTGVPIAPIAGAGWAIGAWAGFGVWLTPETVPLTAAAFGALYVGWLTSRHSAPLAGAIRDTGLAFLLTVGLALAVDPPQAGYAVSTVDRLSLIFAGLALAAAATGLAIPPIDRRVTSAWMRFAASAPVAVIAGGVWLAVFRGTLFGPHALLDSAAITVMASGVVEMQPIVSVGTALQNLLTGTLATLILATLTITRRSVVLAYAAACAAMLVVMAQQHIRFSSYPAALGAAMLPVALPLLEQHLRAGSQRTRALPRLAMLLLFLPVPLFAGVLPSPFQPAQARPPALPSCSVTHLTRMLAPYAGAVVLTDINDVPELLYRTRIDTVGSLYLRNAPAFMRLRAAWRSLPSPDAPPAIRAAHIRYVLFCRRRGRSPLVADLPPDTLLDRLDRSEVPPWLQAVASDRNTGNVLYAVRH